MKFSTKLGLWFFCCILIIEAGSMLFLHKNVVESLVEEELHSLLARGNSHRDVLKVTFDENTLQHIALMESKTDTEVVITNEEGNVIKTSFPVNEAINRIIKPNYQREQIVQKDWKSQPYIATASPYQTSNGETGIVYMLKSTNQIQGVIKDLNHHFGIAVVIILFFLIITNFILIKILTKPLISMNNATKKISKGDFSLHLPVNSKDELGDLAKSINTLANNLNFLQQERKEFLASISHELRTPLTYIKGYADIALKSNLNDNQRMEYIKIIHEESSRVSTLLEELFELAKMDQNSFIIQKERVDVSSFIKLIYEKVKPIFSSTGIGLIFLEQPGNIVNIDPVRFEQVILNLLDNALKYSNGGVTTIEIKKTKNHVILAISDQGVGIPEEELPFIFDSLYRVEKSRSRLTGGVGLGLSIVKEIVEAHDAELHVASKLGAGTTVSVLLKEA
ncbi:sensor histidine kinase [Alkalihalobacillus pseudalcaliphilus]|uniref:sensor histidine kinase n=1 Tax=Alkalihalobacillus pseudalcaliphilus TaxID=79884 RepID=UPI00064DA486|nr:HAMP domain-containing sensor histidine kinase [Alkalihalobacillus pseudalcaliphilus]KMK76327.1 hypothetical protein AB990_14070 [Alkalihalobacillus pseudalcaliphilus]